MIIAIITRLIGNCLISFKSSKGSSIYLSPSLFQSLSLIISITANISGINKQSQKLTLCADKRASLPYTKPRPNNRTELSASELQQVHYFIYHSLPILPKNVRRIIGSQQRRYYSPEPSPIVICIFSKFYFLSFGRRCDASHLQRAPSPMLKLVVIFRVARKFDCTVFVKQTTRLFCLILR